MAKLIGVSHVFLGAVERGQSKAPQRIVAYYQALGAKLMIERKRVEGL